MRIPQQRAFTLVEVIVVISVLALLAGIALPMLGTTTNDARVAKLVATVDQLRKACQRHHGDTRQYAIEQTGATGAVKHSLSAPQQAEGWRGPYLDHALSAADNPFESFVHVHDELDVNRGGFDLDGNGDLDLRGRGNVAIFGNVDEESAQRIDAALDRGIPGDWNETGRVQWRRNTLFVLLYVEGTAPPRAPQGG
ncbi:MAG: prepilin-type N-terminal cleavage/methylation domain-containing protein [Planctomycetes bacterium]|nr:prepilin-type N-terminal cleavage/methylation domain-containing protein [Planctomycetota bacterium]